MYGEINGKREREVKREEEDMLPQPVKREEEDMLPPSPVSASWSLEHAFFA